MPFTTQQLTAEINTDPAGLGYAAFVTAHDRPGLAAAMNLPRAGITVKRTDVMASEVIEAVDSRDFATAPNAGHVAFMQALLTKGAPLRFQDDAGADTKVLGNIKRLLVADDATHFSRAALNALATRNGSRAEQLWGTGTTITEQNIADTNVIL